MDAADEVLEKLMQDYLKQHAVLERLKTTILSIAESYGRTVEFPTSAGEPVKTRAIRPGLFFGMSATNAADPFLELMDEPMTTDTILEGLEAGGLKIGGKQPRQTLYTHLVRATQRFV